MMDYEALASSMDDLREALAAIVAGLMEDGFTEEQARIITAGLFVPDSEVEDDDEEPESE